MTDTNLVTSINQKINLELTNETKNALLKTTFKGLGEVVMRQAIMEGMLRGFDFEDFLEKNVYAIPFGKGYSLITSIGHARKIAMKNGLIGKTAPKIEQDEKGSVISCEITITKLLNGEKGEFSAKVYFSEYTTGRDLWKWKPITMISKVAEMHALRMAFPQDLSQMYDETELEKEIIEVEVEDKDEKEEKLTDDLREKVKNAKTKDDLLKLYKENEGIGKEFTELLTLRKEEIKKQDEKTSDETTK